MRKPGVKSLVALALQHRRRDRAAVRHLAVQIQPLVPAEVASAVAWARDAGRASRASISAAQRRF